MSIIRCIWAEANQRYIEYHDNEWGLPVRNDDRILFEVLSLGQLQDGLSRLMILERRNEIRRAFKDFIPEKVALYDNSDINVLMSNSKIIRNEPKILAIISNAKAILAVKEEFASFASFVWTFVDGKPIQNVWKSYSEVPPLSSESTAMSKNLQKRNFKRVSPKICYSFMQAIGMVNDHTVDCFRHEQVKNL